MSKKVLIGGVRFIQHDDGRFELDESTASIVLVEDLDTKYISYHEFNNHAIDYSTTVVMGEWAWNGCQKFHRSEAAVVFDKFDVPARFRLEIMEQFAKFIPGVTKLDPKRHDRNYELMASLCGLGEDHFSEVHIRYLVEHKMVDDVIAVITKFPNLVKYLDVSFIVERLERFKGIPDFVLPFLVQVEIEPDINKQVLLYLEHHQDVEFFVRNRNDIPLETLKTFFDAMNAAEHYNDVGQDSSGYRTICELMLDAGYQFTDEELKYIEEYMQDYELLMIRCGCDVECYCDSLEGDIDDVVAAIYSPVVSKVSMKTLYTVLTEDGTYPNITKMLTKMHPYVLEK